MKGEHVSATMAMATVVHTLFCLSCTCVCGRSSILHATPRHAIPHHTTPHHTTPHNATPHHTTPHHTKSHHTKSHHTKSHHTTPHHTTPHHTTPHQTTPHHTTPHTTPNNLEVVEEGSENIVGSDGLGDVAEGVDGGSPDGLLVRLDKLEQLEADTHPLPGRYVLRSPVGYAPHQVYAVLLHLLVPWWRWW